MFETWLDRASGLWNRSFYSLNEIDWEKASENLWSLPRFHSPATLPLSGEPAVVPWATIHHFKACLPLVGGHCSWRSWRLGVKHPGEKLEGETLALCVKLMKIANAADLSLIPRISSFGQDCHAVTNENVCVRGMTKSKSAWRREDNQSSLSTYHNWMWSKLSLLRVLFTN